MSQHNKLQLFCWTKNGNFIKFFWHINEFLLNSALMLNKPLEIDSYFLIDFVFLSQSESESESSCYELFCCKFFRGIYLASTEYIDLIRFLA